MNSGTSFLHPVQLPPPTQSAVQNRNRNTENADTLPDWPGQGTPLPPFPCWIQASTHSCGVGTPRSLVQATVLQPFHFLIEHLHECSWTCQPKGRALLPTGLPPSAPSGSPSALGLPASPAWPPSAPACGDIVTLFFPRGSPGLSPFCSAVLMEHLSTWAGCVLGTLSLSSRGSHYLLGAARKGWNFSETSKCPSRETGLSPALGGSFS